MFSDEFIAYNKEKFIDLVKSINREGAKIDALLNKLENSDFFEAPASTKYHNNFPGGLCDHSLNVYYNLCSLIKSKQLEEKISEDSIKIVALFHDISKMNLYEKTAFNKKVYCKNGDKFDDLGNFTWKSELGYKRKDCDKRFVYGNHEQTSEYMIRNFIPLTLEESIAILHHMGGKAIDSCPMVTSEVFDTYPLALLLHTADLLSTFIDENIVDE